MDGSRNGDSDTSTGGEATAAAPREPRLATLRGRLRRIGWPVLAVVVALLLLWYPIGMAIQHVIDDDPDFVFAETDLPPGGSRVVAMAAALIDREVNQHGWVANDPFFMPSALLDNMPNWQMGMVAALARFAFELTDQIGRTRGSSRTDQDLQEAAGLLQYSGTRWVFDLSVSLAPTATSEAQYRRARQALLSYNRRLADGETVFERRADNLMATLSRFALDLGSSSAALDQHIRDGWGGWLDTEADDLFYSVKGQAYAYYLLSRELGADFEAVLRERELEPAWNQMLESLRHAAVLDPLVILNGAPQSVAVPSHLAAQGFYLLRARTQMREVIDILLK